MKTMIAILLTTILSQAKADFKASISHNKGEVTKELTRNTYEFDYDLNLISKDIKETEFKNLNSLLFNFEYEKSLHNHFKVGTGVKFTGDEQRFGINLIFPINEYIAFKTGLNKNFERDDLGKEIGLEIGLSKDLFLDITHTNAESNKEINYKIENYNFKTTEKLHVLMTTIGLGVRF